MTAQPITVERLRALADGPALDLPEVHYVAPDEIDFIGGLPLAGWGDPDGSGFPGVAADPAHAVVWVAAAGWTTDGAIALAQRILSACAFVQEAQR